ncbi:MAG: colicin V synthesis protein [Polaromonas sp.]|nr:colicin V synthesis protein [Polaromonas sp.]
MELNAVDVALALGACLSLAVGAWRGFLYEVFSLAGWVAAFFAARWLAADVAAQLPMGNASEGLRFGVAFVAVFVVAAFLAGLVSWLIRKLAVKVGLRPVDRVLGAFFGAVRAAVLLVVLAFGVTLTPLAKHEAWVQSSGAQFFVGVAQQGKSMLPEELLKVLP